MLDADHLAALTAANDILRSTDAADLDRPVPSCPGWSVEDLVTHIAQVQRWATRIVLAPPGVKVERRIEAPTGPAIIDWFGEGADQLLEAFGTVDLDHEVYAFVGPRPARWWIRRQTHEAVMHAWDRQHATGAPDALEPAVASDGIDELMTEFLTPRIVDTSGFAPGGETVHVHTTDVDGEWLARVAPDEIVVSREHAKGDVALRGPAGGVLLALYGRQSVDEAGADVFGSADLLDRLITNLNF
jgi:uncharacterized protein (TIGR03083 family)